MVHIVRRVAASLWCMALLQASWAQENPDVLRRNPFNDPFIAATLGLPSCPVPRGPAYTDSEIRREAHNRIERGTSCWLAGKCSEPNAFRYDARIAQDAVAALKGDASLASSSIWVIAERRFIYLQGCVTTKEQADRAEALIRAVPDVQLVIPMLVPPGEKPRYPLDDQPLSPPP
jgi:hypothetical protein